MKVPFRETIFSRIFIFNIVLILVCMIILGSMQAVMVSNYIAQQSEETLRKTADTIVDLIEDNISLDVLHNILNGFSKTSRTHIIVINERGEVLVNTMASSFMKENPAFLPEEYSKSVLAGEKNSIMGTMSGLFRETMFTLQVPVYADKDQVIGAVSISVPIPERQRMTNGLIRIMLLSAIVVILLAFVLSYILARRFSRPIKHIRDSAKEFARGNLHARVGEIATQSQISEIKHLAETINNMAYELEKVEEVRTAFISDVSHELRTPMTTISGFVYGVLDDTIPQDRQKEYLQIVYDEVTRLSRLVNNFLDISRMQSDKLTLNMTNFDINEMIRLTIISLEERISEKKIDVNLEFITESCFVRGDADSIRRVLTNLLDNAVKFTNENGVITISTACKQQEVVISVRNTGCGIPKAQQNMIFERLYKADRSRSANREGTGIGLYLVKNILRTHGKTITVDSVEGEYAMFTFTLDRGKMLPKNEEI